MTRTATGASISERTALLRGVPDSFPECVVAGPRPPLDVAVAREQHAGYRRALEDAGWRTIQVAGDEAHPDSPFVEDTAVVIGGTAVVTRPGAPSRRGEVGPIAAVLGTYFDVRGVDPPATIDGGDVLAVGRQLFVGISARTNRAGLRALAETAEPLGYAVTPVAVPGALHLKSAVTAVDERTLVGDARRVDRSEFDAYQWLDVPPGEERAANVLAVGGGRVLVAAGFERTAEMLEGAGLQPVPVDASEFAKADGALTCLSLRW